jgi:hypothetical protein
MVFLFTQLKVGNTIDIVEKSISPVKIEPNLANEVAAA